MNLLGVAKDLLLLPVNIALDVTMIGPVCKIVIDADAETPFTTEERLKSLAENVCV